MLVDCIHTPVACKMIEQDVYARFICSRGYSGMTESWYINVLLCKFLFWL